MTKISTKTSRYWSCKNSPQPAGPPVVKRPDGGPPTAHQYIRVSSDRQADEGMSLEAQAANCRAAAVELADKGYSLGECYADAAVSASKVMFTERPGATRLLGAVRNGDVIVVQRIDRAFRDPGDQYMTIADLATRGVLFFEASGRRLVDVKDPNTEFLIGVLGSVNRLTNRIRTAQVSEAKGAALDRGEFPFKNIPLGYKRKVKTVRGKRRLFIEPCPQEIEILDAVTAVDDVHGSNKGYKITREAGLKFRGRLIDTQQMVSWLALRWRERRSGKMTPTLARMLRAGKHEGLVPA